MKIVNKYAFKTEATALPMYEMTLASEEGVFPMHGLYLAEGDEPSAHPGSGNVKGNQLNLLQTISDFPKMWQSLSRSHAKFIVQNIVNFHRIC